MVETVTFAAAETGANPPPAVTAADPNRPAWLPENFKTPEDLAASYKELQAKLTQTSQQKAALEKAPTEQDQQNAAAEAVQAVGFNVAPYSEEFSSTGDVAPENRDKIAEGLKSVLGEDARSIVDQYIEGQRVLSENNTKLFLDAAGGKEAYGEMIGWAGKSLSKAEADHFNSVVTSGDRTATLFAIEALRARFERAEGRSPSLLKGGGGGVMGDVPFRSTAEMTSAMRDPRYKTDAAYREQVARKLAVSGI